MSDSDPQTKDAGEQKLPGGLSQRLLDILICPACRNRVELKPDGSGLRCVECHLVYPVRDGIPIMLVAEAKAEA